MILTCRIMVRVAQKCGICTGKWQFEVFSDKKMKLLRNREAMGCCSWHGQVSLCPMGCCWTVWDTKEQVHLYNRKYYIIHFHWIFHSQQFWDMECFYIPTAASFSSLYTITLMDFGDVPIDRTPPPWWHVSEHLGFLNRVHGSLSGDWNYRADWMDF